MGEKRKKLKRQDSWFLCFCCRSANTNTMCHSNNFPNCMCLYRAHTTHTTCKCHLAPNTMQQPTHYPGCTQLLI